MPKVTHYQIAWDEQISLVPGTDPSHSSPAFNLPELPGIERRDNAILAWVVDTESIGQQLEVKFNGFKVTLTAKLTNSAYQTVHEVVDKQHLKPTGNVVTMTVMGGGLPMRISDVVLWWQFNT